jgi:hypothetical protein
MLFGNQIIADIVSDVKVRSYWSKIDPNPT